MRPAPHSRLKECAMIKKTASATLSTEKPACEIRGKFIIFAWPGDPEGKVRTQTRQSLRAQIADLTRFLDEADAIDAAGDCADGLRPAPSYWHQMREKWLAHRKGKSLAERFPSATMYFDAGFIEIEQDIVFITRPNGEGGYQTIAMPITAFAESLGQGAQALADYREKARGKVKPLR